MELTSKGTLALCCFALMQGCSLTVPEKGLPSSAELGNVRGYRVSRVITHFHSPFSYDACDNSGLRDGKINEVCLEHLKQALCLNHIDFLFLSDHPKRMAEYSMRELLLIGNKDQVVLKNDLPYGNRIGSCESGFNPLLFVGFEGVEMALGMTQHLEESAADRSSLYGQDSRDLRDRLHSEAEALVVVPHTENKTLDWIRSIDPDAIEIYNFHANLDPKIRKTDLGVPPFKVIPGLITYLIDPYQQLLPDFAFLHFIEIFPIYFTKWNVLIAEGKKVVGLGGSDSHENVLAQLVSDHERMDSHRRVSRMMSNHFLVQSMQPEAIKEAIKDGRGWVVFEGLGSPVQMDFYATSGADVYGVGETGSIQNGSATLTVKLPTLHSKSPQGEESPRILMRLKRVTSGGNDEIVQLAENTDLIFNTTSPGAYRAEISIIPRHLKKFLGDFGYLAEREFPWIITNHIFLN